MWKDSPGPSGSTEQKRLVERNSFSSLVGGTASPFSLLPNTSVN